jgi:hypothetical protein
MTGSSSSSLPSMRLPAIITGGGGDLFIICGTKPCGK